ncbi:MAG: hypothetical protein IKP47_08345 [Ruminococcus sp.]|nr:hypothetical protein [Ruminococcus sp.]
MQNDFILDEAALEKLNRFTRKPVTAQEVYTFPVVLCDNEIDRDGERFSLPALKKLAELFVGKTGIFDHDPRGEKQTARIFDCEVREEPGRLTLCGEPYTYVFAKAYMMRTDSNRDLITEIEGGIKKEVSVSCSVGRRTCCICGSDRTEHPCGHIKGRRYDGRLCCDILDGPGDAYEWSFVAVPAQTSAGVTKHFSELPLDEDAAELRRRLDDALAAGGKACDMLRREIISLSFLTRPIMAVEAVKTLTGRMTFDELAALRDRLRKQMLSSREADASELFEARPDTGAANSSFKI